MAKSRDGKFRIVSNDEREQTLNQLLTVSITSTSFLTFDCGSIYPIKVNVLKLLCRRWMVLTAILQ